MTEEVKEWLNSWSFTISIILFSAVMAVLYVL